jgi:hypothetical protein
MVIISRKMRWSRHVARVREMRSVYRIFIGKPEGKRPLARPRRRWEDNVRKYLEEIDCEDMDWIHLAQDRNRWRAVVNTVMNLRLS